MQDVRSVGCQMMSDLLDIGRRMSDLLDVRRTISASV